MKHYPQVIQESGQRPDAVMASKKTDTIIVAELAVPWEDRMEQSNVLKEDRYSELTMDLIDKGYRALEDLRNLCWSSALPEFHIL